MAELVEGRGLVILLPGLEEETDVVGGSAGGQRGSLDQLQDRRRGLGSGLLLRQLRRPGQAGPLTPGTNTALLGSGAASPGCAVCSVQCAVCSV